MAKYLVSLVSDQTIPNVLFIKEMSGVDKYIFLNTSEMIKKSKLEMILKSCGISQEKKIDIQVTDDDIPQNDQILKKELPSFDDNDQILVNLTGGTKIMSIGIYNFLKERNAQIYYLPIGKNCYIKVFPVSAHRNNDLLYRLSLEEYFFAHGLTFQSSDSLCGTNQQTQNIFNQFMINAIQSDFLKKMRDLRNTNKNTMPVDESVSAQLHHDWGFPAGIKELKKHQVEYITGGWFEEYVYWMVKNYANLSDNDIKWNINIKRQNTQNELDVAFVYNNSLYIIECKTALKDGEKNLLTETLYKINSLKREFGLNVKSYVMTLDGNLRDSRGNINKDYQNRADLMNICLIDRHDFTNDPLLKDNLSQIFR